MTRTSDTNWTGKRIVVTGGSAGLGRALAIRLAEQGANVIVIARGREKLAEVAAEHENITALAADVSDKHAIYRISGEVIDRLGGIDLLINNASALGRTPMPLLLDTACEELSDVLETNLIGPFRLTKALLPAMLLHGGGTVVNISSDAAVSAYETWGAYSVSKAALDHLSRIWDAELRERGVRFFAIDPGDMHTAMHLAAIPDASPADLYEPGDVARSLVRFLELQANDAATAVRFGAGEWRAFL